MSLEICLFLADRAGSRVMTFEWRQSGLIVEEHN